MSERWSAVTKRFVVMDGTKRLVKFFIIPAAQWWPTSTTPKKEASYDLLNAAKFSSMILWKDSVLQKKMKCSSRWRRFWQDRRCLGWVMCVSKAKTFHFDSSGISLYLSRVVTISWKSWERQWDPKTISAATWFCAQFKPCLDLVCAASVLHSSSILPSGGNKCVR